MRELMRMLSLEFDRNLHHCSQREVQNLIHFFCSNIKDISDEKIQHDHLVTERLVFFDDDCNFAILVQCHYCFIVDQLNHRSGGFGELITAA